MCTGPRVRAGSSALRSLGVQWKCVSLGASPPACWQALSLPGHSFSSPSLGAGLSRPGRAHSVSQALGSPHSLIPGTPVLRARPFIRPSTAALCQAESQPWCPALLISEWLHMTLLSHCLLGATEQEAYPPSLLSADTTSVQG